LCEALLYDFKNFSLLRVPHIFIFFKEFFESPAFRADGLKIYPTLVIRGTGKDKQYFLET
jgi:hypothetical protein